MKLIVKKGKTSKLVQVFIQDSSSTTGAGLTGLTSGSSGLVCYRARSDDGNAGATQLSLSGGTRGTWSSGGFVEKDSTNMPGVYELGLDNNGLASGAEQVIYMLKGATNMAPVLIEIALVDYDPQDTVRLGLTALPNAAAEASGGLFTRGTGAGQINQDANGRIDARIKAGDSTAAVALASLTLAPSAGGGSALIITGGAASGATPAGHAMKLAGGAASTTSGGTAGSAIHSVGGAGAASTNSAAEGIFTSAGVDNGAGGAPGLQALATGTDTHSGIEAYGADNGAGITAQGFGTGHGIEVLSGDGATGDAIHAEALSTNGNGMALVGTGTGNGLLTTGGAGAGGDGIEAAAGGGVPIRGNITGNVTGNLSGSVGSVTARVTADVDRVDGAALDTHDAGSFPADVRTWLGSAPNALQSGRVDSYLGAVASGIIAAASFASGALDAVWSTATRTLTAFSFSVTVGTNNDKTGYGLSAAAVQAIWDALTSALTTAGSIGKLLVDNINATISSRLASASISLSGGAVTVGTNNDKTGYALTAAYDAAKTAAQAGDAMTLTAGEEAAIADAVWEEPIADHSGTAGSTAEALGAAGSAGDPWTTALPGAYGAGSAGKIVGDNLDAKVSTRSTYGGGDTSGVTTLLSRIASALTITGGKVDVNDKTGFALTSAYDAAKTASQAGDAMALTSGERTTLTGVVWAALTSALTTAGSIGKLLVDNVNATISSRLATASYTAPDNAGVAAIKAKTDNLPASPAAVGSAMTLTSGEEDAIVDKVWDEPIAGHSTVGSTGKELDSAATAGDPWTAALPGSYGAGTAGKIVGDNLDAQVSAIKAKTDPLTFTIPNQVDANALTGGGGGGGDGFTADDRETLESIDGKLGSAEVTTITPVSPDGSRITIVRGDDYFQVDGRAISVEVDPGIDLTGATVEFSVRKLTETDPVFTVEGEISAGATLPWKLTAELAADDTELLEGSGGAGKVHAFDFQVTRDGHKLTQVLGACYVLQDSTP